MRLLSPRAHLSIPRRKNGSNAPPIATRTLHLHAHHQVVCVRCAAVGAGADRRRRRRDRLSAELRRPHQAFRPWPDDPRPGGQRAGAGVDRSELRPMAELRPNSARNAGGYDLDRGPALPQPYRHRPDRHRSRARFRLHQRPSGASHLDHHPAARPQHLPDQQPKLRAQDQGSHLGDGARAQIQQKPDPRAVPKSRVFRRRRLWHRRANSSATAPTI
jgi:hypothetical protein